MDDEIAIWKTRADNWKRECMKRIPAPFTRDGEQIYLGKRLKEFDGKFCGKVRMLTYVLNKDGIPSWKVGVTDGGTMLSLSPNEWEHASPTLEDVLEELIDETIETGPCDRGELVEKYAKLLTLRSE